MSIIAGLVSRADKKLPTDLRQALVASFSRVPDERISRVETEHTLMMSLDVGAFGADGSIRDDKGRMLFVAGEPLLTRDDVALCRNRAEEVQRIFDDMCRSGHQSLLDASGTFCACFIDTSSRELVLVADKLGIRPLYYLVTPDFVAFASALRILEGAGLCAGELDERGTYETALLGFPLSDRTCYRSVRTILPSEVVRVSPTRVDHEVYFRWDQLTPSAETLANTLDRLAAKFDAAVRNRLRGDRTTAAFLSGGLDSRAIVAALRRQGASVLTVNFAPAGTQDRVFGELVAKALGTVHLQIDVERSAATDSYRKDQVREWLHLRSGESAGPERPDILWSGDGGSVGLGHVYLSEAAARAMAEGNTDRAIREFFRYNGLVDGNGALTSTFRKKSATWLVDAVRCELESVARMPEGRGLYLFLMFNDQRRHLSQHFEDIDLQRFEFQLPFFDAGFVETIVRAPMSWFLRHKLYNQWLRALSPEAASVPWQAYPNHEPCPIPYEGELRYQWSSYYGWFEAQRQSRKRGARAVRQLLSREFPGHLVDRARLGAAIILTMLGSTSYGHVIQTGTVFAERWARTRASAVRTPIKSLR